VKKITLKDVAQKARVSIWTASVVLNGAKGATVSDETRKRVLQVGRELGYRPNRLAQDLVRSSRGAGAPPKRIGIITSSEGRFGLAHHASLASHARATVIKAGYEVAFFHSRAELADERVFDREIDPNRVGGIFSTQTLDDRFLECMVLRVPRVAIACLSDPVESVSSVTVNFAEGTKLAIKYLMSLGHRRIAFLYSHAGSRRVAAYRECMASAGLPVNEGFLQFYGGKDFADWKVWAAVDRLLELPERPTAIHVGHDDAAREVFRQLRKRGVSVPGEISVIGFHDEDYSARLDPALTTVRLPREQIARESVRCLVRQIERNVCAPVCIELPVTIAQRESCRAVKKESVGLSV